MVSCYNAETTSYAPISGRHIAWCLKGKNQKAKPKQNFLLINSFKWSKQLKFETPGQFSSKIFYYIVVKLSQISNIII